MECLISDSAIEQKLILRKKKKNESETKNFIKFPNLKTFKYKLKLNYFSIRYSKQMIIPDYTIT